ncbi:MAG: QueT transporter family protein [Bacilli bacterium]
MINSRTKMLCENAIIAGLYVVLTAISLPLSFGLIQFRIAEVLMLLCFFRKDFVLGLTVGCLVSNMAMSSATLGSTGWIDVLVGTSATLASGLLMPYCKRLWVASLVPVLLNGLIVGAELAFVFQLDIYWVCFGFVALGEFVCISTVGYALMLILRKKYNFDKIIGSKINTDVRW